MNQFRQEDNQKQEIQDDNLIRLIPNYSRFLPIANINRIMKKALPENAKIAKDAKETVQECVSELISFKTLEAGEKCKNEKMKTINGEDLLCAINTLGFESYVDTVYRNDQNYGRIIKINFKEFRVINLNKFIKYDFILLLDCILKFYLNKYREEAQGVEWTTGAKKEKDKIHLMMIMMMKKIMIMIINRKHLFRYNVNKLFIQFQSSFQFKENIQYANFYYQFHIGIDYIQSYNFSSKKSIKIDLNHKYIITLDLTK